MTGRYEMTNRRHGGGGGGLLLEVEWDDHTSGWGGHSTPTWQKEEGLPPSFEQSWVEQCIKLLLVFFLMD